MTIDGRARDPKVVKSPLELELWRVRNDGGTISCELRSTRAGETLHLEGAFDGAPVSVTATYVDRASHRLLQTPFRWIFD